MTFTPELHLLRYILIYKYYIVYYNSLCKYLKDNQVSFNIISTIKECFDKEQKEELDLNVLALVLSLKFESEFDSIYKPVLNDLGSIISSSPCDPSDSSTDNLVLSILDRVKTRQVASELACLCLEVSEERKPLESLKNALSEALTVPEGITDDAEFISDDLEYLYSHTVLQQGLRWRLQEMNLMLGSLRKGDFGFLFARPETGKTTFLASEISYFAEQADAPILWFNNEEQGEKVALRCYQASLGFELEQLNGDLNGNREKYWSLTGRRIRIYNSAAIHRSTVERLCVQHKPALVVFDQIDKIKGFDGDREDLHLGAIYIWARELAKTYCPVIGVCQANGDGEGRAYLTMDHVSNARTSKQAEADWILGIGKVHNDGQEFVRHLHLSKNKLIGDEDTVPELRHGKLPVTINPKVARYESIKANLDRFRS